MQLKLKRAQRQGGLTGGIVIFILDARVDLTPSEQSDVRRYKLGGQIIYSSEARKNAEAGSMIAGGRAQASGVSLAGIDAFLQSSTDTIGHGLRAVALGAIAHLKLQITIDSLVKGHHIECKTMDELLGCEEAILAACDNLNGYLLCAATFDGRESVIEFTPRGRIHVADATPPTALLSAPQAPPLGPMPLETAPRAVAESAGAAPVLYAPATSSGLPPRIAAYLATARAFLQSPKGRLIPWAAALPLLFVAWRLINFPQWLFFILLIGLSALVVRAVREVL